MPGPCAAACSHSEEECAACLASQYHGAVAKAVEKNFMTAGEGDGLRTIFDGLMMKRTPGHDAAQ